MSKITLHFPYQTVVNVAVLNILKFSQFNLYLLLLFITFPGMNTYI